MSRRALFLAVREVLRAPRPGGLGYQDRDCDLTLPGGQPHPRAGKWFLGIHGGGRERWSGLRNAQAMIATYAFTVTLSMRVNEPIDRIGEYLAKEDHFYDRAEEVVLLLYKDSLNHHVSRRANHILGDPGNGDEPTGFREGIAWMNDGTPRLVGADWFHAEPTSGLVGIALDMHFGMAARLQNLANVGV